MKIITQKAIDKSQRLTGSTPKTACIYKRHTLNDYPVALRYWTRKAVELRHQVDIVDPTRAHLRELRETYPAGTRVYRCSTGGKWGKSAEVVTL